MLLTAKNGFNKYVKKKVAGSHNRKERPECIERKFLCAFFKKIPFLPILKKRCFQGGVSRQAFTVFCGILFFLNFSCLSRLGKKSKEIVKNMLNEIQDIVS